MDQTQELLLVNTESREEHRLPESEYVIGRGWLNCEDKRISRKHGILKLTSNGSLISLTSTHANPIFYKTKNDKSLQMINKDETIELCAGDSFGFFPCAFWFDIVKSNLLRGEMAETTAASPVVDSTSNESTTEAPKRKLPSWMNGSNCKKMRNHDNDVTLPNGDGASTAAGDNSAETNSISTAAVEDRVQDLALETPSKESASEDPALKRKLPANDDANESKRLRNDANEATVSCDTISATTTAATSADQADLTAVESIAQTDAPNDSAVSAIETDASSQQAMEVSNDPIDESSVPRPEIQAVNPESIERPEEADADSANQNEMDNTATEAAPVERSASAAESTADSDDGRTVPLPVVVKIEPVDQFEDNASGNAAVAGPSSAITVKQEVKTEVKAEATNEPDSSSSSKERDCCPYGVKCYRRNPVHRSEMAHPGDIDYRLPSYGDPLPGAPPCPYGIRCYRRNPIHFRQFSHPPSTDPVANRQALRANRNRNINDYEDDDDDIDDNDEDPFADGDDDDDPDFAEDFSTEEEDDESEKDSGLDSNDETGNQAE